MSDVIQLFPRGSSTNDEEVTVLACGRCRNKTFLCEVREGASDYPRLRCAACGCDIGAVGWLGEDE